MKSEIGFFSSEIGLSSQFWAYKLIQTMEKQSKAREEIWKSLQENIDEKNPEVQVIKQSLRSMTMENKMFFYQCQETAGCKGCTMVGVCGKKPDVAAMQDLLVYVSRGISAITTALRKEGKPVAAEINHLITFNLFTTITNANFDRESIEARIRTTLDAKTKLLSQLRDTANLPEAALWDGSGDWEEKPRPWAYCPPKMRIFALCAS